MTQKIGENKGIPQERITDYTGDVIFFKTKNGKHIYKSRYSEEFYLIYPDSVAAGTFTIEKWNGECNC